jgi:hypothetical protein
MMRYTFFFLFAVGSSLSGYAQDTLRHRAFSVALAPQYLIMQAIRVDLEKPLVRGRHIHRLTVSPYLYAGDAPQYDYFESLPTSVQRPDDYGDTRVSGFGLEVLDKYLLRKANRAVSNFYLAFGAGYHRINLDYVGYAPVPFLEGSATLFRFDFTDQRDRINRVDVIGLVGLKPRIRSSILFFDFFAGPVLRNSWINTSAEQPKQHATTVDHGFDGVTFRAGATIGITLF